MGFEGKLIGYEQAIAAINSLKQSVGQQVLQDIAANALRKTVVENLKNNSPTIRGKTISSGIRIKKTAGNQGIGASVGFDKKQLFWLNWFEKGTKERFTKGRGKYKKKAARGKMPAKPFVSQSFDRSVNPLIKYLQENIVKVVLRSIKKRTKT